MTPDDMEMDLLASYRRLHDGLSDMIEGGRLTADDIPDDYRWLAHSLISLAEQGDSLDAAVRADNE